MKINIRIPLRFKELDTNTNRPQKLIVNRVKKTCKTCWLSVHVGVDAVFNDYEGIVKALQKTQSDCSSRSLATILLKEIKSHRFFGTLYTYTL